jgi:hypothetical protein
MGSCASRRRSRSATAPSQSTWTRSHFDLSEHSTYTEEEPNTLLPEEVAVFLSTMRELYPQHLAVTYCGFATGLRPSSLRPLRRRGPLADVPWDQGRLLALRSQTLGEEVMNTTKQGKRYSITCRGS